MGVSASAVKELREISGAGMMDCKRALDEAGNDIKKAMEVLRKAGVAKAQKKAGYKYFVFNGLHSNFVLLLHLLLEECLTLQRPPSSLS